MLKNKIYGLIVLLLFTATSTLLAQNAKEDFAKISHAYSDLKPVSISIDYALYTDHKTTTPQEEKISTVIVSKNLYYNNFAGVEVLREKSVAVVADHERKLLILQPSKASKKDKVFPMDIDSELKSYQLISYKKINDHLSQYSLILKKGKVEKLVFDFNTESYLIENMVVFYREVLPESGQKKTPPRVEIRYTYSPLTDEKRKEISVNKYFAIIKGKYIPKEPFRKYEFVNKLNR